MYDFYREHSRLRLAVPLYGRHLRKWQTVEHPRGGRVNIRVLLWNQSRSIGSSGSCSEQTELEKAMARRKL